MKHGKVEYQMNSKAKELSYREKKESIENAVKSVVTDQAMDAWRKARLNNLHLAFPEHFD